MTIVTLLTDFGLGDTYVGQVKGAVLAVAPCATLVDLTHAVPPQDVEAGAFLLWGAVEAFPPGTIHLAVVDPGVGTARRAVAVRARRGDVLVGPDNGLLGWALDRLGGSERAVELSDRRFWGPRSSGTFHGRDIFAPAAGHLAADTPIEDLGRPIDVLVDAPPWPQPRREDDVLIGVVMHVDAYGNLVTNLPEGLLPPRCEVLVGDARIVGAPHPHFQSVAPGHLLAIVGSAGLLEIADRDSSAAERLRIGRRAPIRVVGT